METIHPRLASNGGKLTDDDLEVAKGRRDELVGKIQERYGITKEEANRQVDDWIKSLDP